MLPRLDRVGGDMTDMKMAPDFSYMMSSYGQWSIENVPFLYSRDV